MQELINMMAGNFNESGWLNNLCKRGFTFGKSISELISNSIDANAKNVYLYVTENKLIILDDGDGLNKKTAENMFNMYNENHKDEKKMGVSGVGAKHSLFTLSHDNSDKPNEIKIYSINKKNNCKIYINIPWDKIMCESRYTKMVIIKNMNNEQIYNFNNLYTKLNLNKNGTMIEIPMSLKLKQVIEEQFNCEFNENKIKFLEKGEFFIII